MQKLLDLVEQPAPVAVLPSPAPVTGGPNIAVYCENTVRERLARLGSEGGDALRKIRRQLERMIVAGGTRPLAPVRPLSCLDQLAAKFPNFRHVIEYVGQEMALLGRSKTVEGFTLQPLLLVGPPGVGKTYFSTELARALGVACNEIPMQNASAAFVLQGLDAGWGSSKPGAIFDLMMDSSYGNPFVVLDEIEKAGGDHRMPATGPLYALLDRKTATRFLDECVQVPIDCSAVSFIATANKLDTIPEPILSRLTVLEVGLPGEEEQAGLVRNVYADLLASSRWGETFDPELADDVVNQLRTTAAREVAKLLRQAAGKAAIRGRGWIECCDIDIAPQRAMSFGFI